MRQWINLIEMQFLDYAKHISFPEYGPNQEVIEQHVHDFIKKLENVGYNAHYGRTRVAMISPDQRSVIKIPMNDRGITDNGRERRAFISTDSYIPMAACRIFYADKAIGVPMLMMRFVTPIRADDYSDIPNWVYSVDGGQVGHDHRGKLVAYDL